MLTNIIKCATGLLPWTENLNSFFVMHYNQEDIPSLKRTLDQVSTNINKGVINMDSNYKTLIHLDAKAINQSGMDLEKTQKHIRKSSRLLHANYDVLNSYIQFKRNMLDDLRAHPNIEYAFKGHSVLKNSTQLKIEAVRARLNLP